MAGYLTGGLKHTYFNSIKVRLELHVEDSILPLLQNFNSIKVRLEPFFSNSSPRFFTYFNSIKVRLELPSTNAQAVDE